MLDRARLFDELITESKTPIWSAVLRLESAGVPDLITSQIGK
jgi:hypothetical protein